MRRLVLLLVILLCTIFHIFSQSIGGRRYVAVQTTVLRSSTGFFASKVGILTLGDEVTLIRDNGKWAQIRWGDLSGWVASSSLSARRFVSSGAGSSPGEVALAGKGFTPELEIEYRTNGLDYSMVDSMEQITIPPDELIRFITEGHLAMGE